MLKKLKRGFTLVEVVVVMVIIGILAAISMPSFNAVISRTEAMAAKTTMLSLVSTATSLAAQEGRTIVTEQDLISASAGLVGDTITSLTATYTVGTQTSTFTIATQQITPQ